MNNKDILVDQLTLQSIDDHLRFPIEYVALGAGIALVAAAAWYGASRVLVRRADATAALMRDPSAASGVLFLGGMMSAAVLCLLYLGAFWLGLTPATASERQMIELVRSSELATKPQVRAALSVADGALYVSKGDATRIANSIQADTRQ